MKNKFIVLVPVLLWTACNQAELTQSNHDKDSLASVVSERDASINDLLESFNDVERNLDSVAIKQHIITVNSDKTGELKATQKLRINEEITAINKLMDQNRKRIAELNRKIKNSSSKNLQLEKLVATLNNQLAQKEIELTDLNEKLNALHAQVAQLEISVDTLSVQNSVQAQTIVNETAALHTAYFIIGQSNELQDAKIIDRKGGLLGIGKTSKLTGDFDNNKFTKIDYTQTNSIPVNSEMKMITSHPSDSYRLESDEKDKDIVKNIVITDPEKFWSVSRYLVVIKS